MVTGIAHRRPQGESYDQAIRNDETGLWQCPFCQQDNFPELSEVGIGSVTFSRKDILCYAHKQNYSYHCGFLRCGITLTAAPALVKPSE